MWFVLFVLIICAYLLGSVPASYLAAKSRGIDLRQHGTNQVGGGNLWRTTSMPACYGGGRDEADAQFTTEPVASGVNFRINEFPPADDASTPWRSTSTWGPRCSSWPGCPCRTRCRVRAGRHSCATRRRRDAGPGWWRTPGSSRTTRPATRGCAPSATCTSSTRAASRRRSTTSPAIQSSSAT